MNARSTNRSLAAAALAGGLTLGLGMTVPASAVPWFGDREPSVGQLCQQAERTTIVTPDGELAPSLDGVRPGLRCGQLFGKAKAYGLDRPDEPTDEPTATPTEEPTEEPTDSTEDATESPTDDLTTEPTPAAADTSDDVDEVTTDEDWNPARSQARGHNNNPHNNGHHGHRGHSNGENSPHNNGHVRGHGR